MPFSRCHAGNPPLNGSRLNVQIEFRKFRKCWLKQTAGPRCMLSLLECDMAFLPNRNDSAIQPLVRDYHSINNGDQVNVRVPSELTYLHLLHSPCALILLFDSTPRRESGYTCQSRSQSLVRKRTNMDLLPLHINSYVDHEFGIIQCFA